ARPLRQVGPWTPAFRGRISACWSNRYAKAKNPWCKMRPGVLLHSTLPSARYVVLRAELVAGNTGLNDLNLLIAITVIGVPVRDDCAMRTGTAGAINAAGADHCICRCVADEHSGDEGAEGECSNCNQTHGFNFP